MTNTDAPFCFVCAVIMCVLSVIGATVLAFLAPAPALSVVYALCGVLAVLIAATVAIVNRV